MTKNKKLLVCFKLFFSLLGFSAIVTEIATLAERGTLNSINFFSYFTIETNLLVSAILLLSALATIMDKNAKLDAWRAATTVYILVVGIGFAVLLAGLENVALTAVPWDNTVLHYIMPVAVFVDYLVDRPTRRLTFKRSLVWSLVPVAYLAYSLTRGQLIGWYPYPFLNPSNDGYGSVAVTAFGLLILTLGLIWTMCQLSRKRTKTI